MRIKIKMWTLSFLIIILLFVYQQVFGVCYFAVYGSQDPIRDSNFAGKILTRYVEPVKDIPLDGIREGECLYIIDVIYVEAGVQIQINGPRNFEAEAEDFRRAMLSSLLDVSKVELCKRYVEDLVEKCGIGVDVLFFDREGNFTLKPNHKFHIILVPRKGLYVYVVNRDIDNKVKLLFPSVDQKNPLIRKKVYIIPSIESGEYFYAEDFARERVYLLFSLKPINDAGFLMNPVSRKGVFQKILF